MRSAGYKLLRALKVAAVVETGAITVLAVLGQLIVRGKGPLAGAAFIAQDPLFLTQIPGLLLLSELGVCCGVDGGYITHDSPPHLMLRGAPLLGVANFPFVLALGLVETWICHQAKARSSAT